MTEHLPECPHSEPALSPGFLVMCICDRLRACEQRVLSLNPVAHDVLIAQRARERALDTAREAIVDLLDEEGDACFRKCLDDALAAIDALREEKP